MRSTGKPTTRRDLLYLLAQASELEHSLACQYLFAAFSLKEGTAEGLTSNQLRIVRSWRSLIIGIAVQEMLHLALASNLLTAIGGAPYLRRANFPQGKTYTSLSLRFILAPLNQDTLKRFICFELPQDFAVQPGETDWNKVCEEIRAESDVVFALPEPLLPQKLEYHSIGELYGLVSEGFQAIEAELQARGKTLFIGPLKAQATGIWPELKPVTDVSSAQRAIEVIVEQGEGTPRDQINNHFRRFIKTLTEFQAEQAATPMFQPARPVINNPLLDLQHDQPAAVSLGAQVLTNELARDVVEIFGASYEVMLQILGRYFANAEEDEEQIYILKSAFLNLMAYVLSPLGSTITLLPAGDGFASMNAGPSFEVFSDVQLLPQVTSAWPYFRERLEEIAAACDFVANLADATQIKDTMSSVSIAIRRISDTISLLPPGLTWENGIKQLFSPMDIEHMKRLFLDLDSYEAVRDGAVNCENPGNCILDKVAEKSMPKLPLGPWTDQRIEHFKQWVTNGMPRE